MTKTLKYKRELKVGDYFYIGNVEYKIEEMDISRVYYYKNILTGERSFFDIEYLWYLINCGIAKHRRTRDPAYFKAERAIEKAFSVFDDKIDRIVGGAL